MLKFTPNKSQLELMYVLAHILIASQVESVDGGKGFMNDFIKNSLTNKQQAMWSEFQRYSNKIKQDFLAMMEKDRVKDNA